MSEGKVSLGNSRLKRNTYDEVGKDEPPFKSQRLFFPFDDDQNSQGPTLDFQYENSEITEQNYDKIAATTLYKKLQVLETRDRLLRATTTQPIKEINVDEIKPMEGTCQDMCPEKERLLRIHGNMVSQFECKLIDTKLEPDIEIMVKQYARSSADQANALSHELRPTPVLLKTMNYMLRNIIYPIESNIEQDLASWYDFCWDRLRAIRKDIVQQNLQNSEVITILEQIGRFHIACYDLMLGYPGFDIKLNTENLNNCIQMLMPMYRDLDHQCLNEPEFVSYELLMHLGNPQFHSAYDLLPIHIKQSSQVRFCIQAHTTYLQSSDCIEFFNLLKGTTFMNCCILQRVIPNVRYNSIKMINMSYTTAKRSYKLEINHLMEKLCFNDIQSAKEFCSDVQLKCDDLYVNLSRNTDIHAPEQRRKKQEFIITQKRQNLTFLISGIQKLPDFIISPVHSNFSENDRFNDLANNAKNGLNELNVDLKNEESDSQMEMDACCSSSNSKDSFLFNKQEQLVATTKVQTPVFDVPTYTFKLPKSSTQVETAPPFKFDFSLIPPKTFSTCELNDNPLIDQSNLPTSSNSLIASNLTRSPIIFSQDLFTKTPSPSPTRSIQSSPIESPIKINSKEKIEFTHLKKIQINLAKKYFFKWQNFVNQRKSKCIEEMFAHGELFHSECISSLSSSPSSVKSIFDMNDIDVEEEPKELSIEQFFLAKKYFYIWLRKMLRMRRKIEIDPINSLPWSVFMQVHGTPKETFPSPCLNLKAKEDKRCLKIPIRHSLSQNQITNDDISKQMADLFVKNVFKTKREEIFGNKLFWKLAINYAESSDSNYIEDKVKTIIYGKLGFSNNQTQSIYTDYNKYFIKSVQSCTGLHKWMKSGINAALVFTNTIKEDMETFFKRLESILQTTPTAIPLVVIFSSSSNKSEIENYESVLDAYQENDYINNYSIYMWDGPKTILEAIEFFSNHYVDITPGMRSEKLFYNLLSFAQPFYVKVRSLLPENNPNTIIEKYNQYLDAYIERLGKKNQALNDLAHEFLPHHTQNPEKFSEKYSNLNTKYFEDLLKNAHLSLYKSWPPKSIDDLIEYVKNMCNVTNRRCWCLDILQMLQLHRKADLEHCLLNANWFEVIEMWIEGALEKCSDKQDCFTVFYDGDPITDVIKIVFPQS